MFHFVKQNGKCGESQRGTEGAGLEPPSAENPELSKALS